MQHKVYCDNHCLSRQICHTKYTGVLTSIGLYIFISFKRGSSCLLTLCHLIPIVPAKHQKNQLFCVCGIAHYRYHMRDIVHICLFASGFFCSKYFQSSSVSSQRKIVFPFKGWIVSHWNAYTAFGFTMHLLMSILFFWVSWKCAVEDTEKIYLFHSLCTEVLGDPMVFEKFWGIIKSLSEVPVSLCILTSNWLMF